MNTMKLHFSRQHPYAYLKQHKKIFIAALVVLLVLVIGFFINRALFASSASSSREASQAVDTQLKKHSESTFENSQDFVDYITKEQDELLGDMRAVSINYPRFLAILTEPFSSDKRNEINQLYRSTEASDTYATGFANISESKEIVQCLPSRDSLTEDTDNFIRKYEDAFARLNRNTSETSAIDLSTISRIIEIILSSAKTYKETGDADMFYNRYDNVFSEMEKELLLSYTDFLSDSRAFYGSLAERFERL